MATTNSSTPCDRRLSRAARELVIEQMEPILRRYRDGKSSASSNARTSTSNKRSPQGGYDHHETLSQLQKLLDEFILKDKDNNNNLSPSCPLLPSRDMYWQDELHSPLVLPSHIWTSFRPPRKVSVVQWGIPRYLAWMKYLNTHDHPKHQPHYHSHWFQCQHCQKLFSSRYYLDQHMIKQHHHNILESNHHHHQQQEKEATISVEVTSTMPTTTTICSAVDWCETLVVGGAAACAQTALHNEPYYGRGSGGLIQADRTLVYHRLRLQTHATTSSWCTSIVHNGTTSLSSSTHSNLQASLEASRLRQEQHMKACQTALDHCFETPLAKTLQTELCQHLFNCSRRHHPHHYHRALALPEHWKDEWDYYARQAYAHPLIWILLLFALVTFAVARQLWWNFSGPSGYSYYRTSDHNPGKKNRQQHAAGSRLLQPLAGRRSQGQSVGGWWPSSSWFRINSPQTHQSPWKKKSKLQ